LAIRIAFATENGGLESPIAQRFGRAPKFTIVEVDENTGRVLNVEVYDNPGYAAGSGAGVKAAQKLGELNVKVVVGPTPGPNAYAALQYLGIRVVPLMGTTVKEALPKIIDELNKT